jgi:hypothetical protein
MPLAVGQVTLDGNQSLLNAPAQGPPVQDGFGIWNMGFTRYFFG